MNGDQSESRLPEPSDGTLESANQENQSNNSQTNQSKRSLESEDQSNTAAQRESGKVLTEQNKDSNNTTISSKSDKNNRTAKTNSTATTKGDYQEFSTMGETEALMLAMSTMDNEKGNDTADSEKHEKGSDTVHASKSETITTANDEFSEMGDTEAVMQELSTVEHDKNSSTRNSDKNVSNKTVTNIDTTAANVEVEEMDTGTPSVTVKPRQSGGRKQILEKQSASQKENVSSSGRSTPIQNRVRVRWFKSYQIGPG